jgi:hypothetical protein
MNRRMIVLVAIFTAFIFSALAGSSGQKTAAQNTVKGLSGPNASAKPAPTPASTNVTTTVYDFDATGMPFLFRSDDHTGVGQGTYGTGSGVFSGINSAGDWRLELFNQSVRTLWITPNNPINSSQPTGPPAGYYWQNVEAYSKCYDQSGNAVPFPSLVNGSDNCSLGVDFNSNGTKYKFVMSPRLPAPGGPATGFASVACNSVINNQCVNWTITPSTLVANTSGIADLFYYNKRGALVFVGQYYNTFRIDASKQ